jgi:dynein heavy chain
MGRFIVVQNCSESITYRSMSQLIAGAAQSGVWLNFDEFIRIDVTVMSAVAWQLTSMFTALAQKKNRFVLDGREMKIDPAAGIFMTYNPSNFTRFLIPENIRKQFRPLALTIPDSPLIVEVMLLIAGFGSCRLLARRLDAVFKMLAMRLSKSPQYHFGLRTLVACTRVAHSLRLAASKGKSDETVLSEAINTIWNPRLNDEDRPIFTSIMGQYFALTKEGNEVSTSFSSHLREELTRQNLIPFDSLLTKMVQLHDLTTYQRGIILLGNPGSSKSTCWKVLASTVNHMSTPESPLKVNSTIINPKAFSSSSIFGGYDVVTDEWRDGILLNLIRNFGMSPPGERNWLVMDGPIDATWVESMNTALDDTQVLSVGNGQRIPIPRNTIMIFEACSLANAAVRTIIIIINFYRV